MRELINAVLMEAQVGDTILITDIYDTHELTDESELISQFAPPIDWKKPLVVRQMSWEQARDLKTSHGNTIVDAFRDDASKAQQKIVKRKVKNFDHNRIVVICGEELVDGHHHVIAAIETKNAILYVDLADWD